MRYRQMIPTAAVLLTLILPAAGVRAQGASAVQETVTIPTYPFSEPDPLPILVTRPAIWPYFSFRTFGHEAEARAWTTVRLENDFIRVLLLPEVGGKVWGAIEKGTGEEFLYLNSVLKFRQIAMRGPWTSGGTEFNFGLVGHTPACATPVDYLVRTNPDGSVSCFVGTLDLPSRTRWSVEVRLPPDAACYEMHSRWSNPTPYRQSYYAWMNNAVRTGDDLRYIYPGTSWVPHGYDLPLNPWPVTADGRDLSWYRNNDYGADHSYFVFGTWEDFYGGYWHESDFGYGHWARYDDLPGKKVWIWALSRQGAIWEDLLTDTDGQYSEPQAGRLLSQSDHALFAPLTSDAWSEALFPVRGIGGLVKASPYAALNVERREDGGVRIAVCALRRLDDELLVTCGGRTVLRERLELGPMQVRDRVIDLSGSGGGDYLTVEVGEKLQWSEDPADTRLERPFPFRTPDESTPEGLYLAGEWREQRREYAAAMQKYRACLAGEPQHVRAMTRLAELHCRRAEYDIALGYARQALEISMYDPEANYVYALICRRTGRSVDAMEAFGWAARSPGLRSNAWTQLAELNLAAGRLAAAAEYVRRARGADAGNLRAARIEAIVHRRRGRGADARLTLGWLLGTDPLDHLARFELYLLDPSEERRDEFTGLIRSELPHEHYLEMAVFYASLGLNDEARQLLELAPDHPVVQLWRAWLERGSRPEESRRLLTGALAADAQLVFPFREETIPVLEWARAEAAVGGLETWKADWYLGLVLGGLGRTDEALELFRGCGDVSFAPLHLTVGYLDPAEALSRFRRACELEPDSWQNVHHLVTRLLAEGGLDEALAVTEKAAAEFPGKAVLTMDRARVLFRNGGFAATIGLLDALEMLPYEGGWEAQNLWMRSHVRLALEEMASGRYRDAIDHLEAGKAYPENLGTGAPYEPDTRLQDYLIAVCWERVGRRGRAEAYRQAVADYTVRHGAGRGPGQLFGLLALRDLGRGAELDRLLADLEARPAGDAPARWALAVYRRNRQDIERLEPVLAADPRTSPLIPAAAVLAELIGREL